MDAVNVAEEVSPLAEFGGAFGASMKLETLIAVSETKVGNPHVTGPSLPGYWNDSDKRGNPASPTHPSRHRIAVIHHHLYSLRLWAVPQKRRVKRITTGKKGFQFSPSGLYLLLNSVIVLQPPVSLFHPRPLNLRQHSILKDSSSSSLGRPVAAQAGWLKHRRALLAGMAPSWAVF